MSNNDKITSTDIKKALAEYIISNAHSCPIPVLHTFRIHKAF